MSDAGDGTGRVTVTDYVLVVGAAVSVLVVVVRSGVVVFLVQG